MEQRDRRGGQEYVDKDENFKSGGEIRVSDPWELNPPKNQRIPRRNQEIATKGLESSPLGVLESGEEKRSEGVSFTWVGIKNTET
jgi:hypothetical protein